MARDLPYLPSPAASGSWPTFSLDMGTRQNIASGRGPRASGSNPSPQGAHVGVMPPPPLNPGGAQDSNPGGVGGGNVVRRYDPATGQIIRTPQAQTHATRPGEPGGIKPAKQPIRTAGPQ